MEDATPSTRRKALALNLDPVTYGGFAEAGGGQEVARWFFEVGGAAGTVAKTVAVTIRTKRLFGYHAITAASGSPARR